MSGRFAIDNEHTRHIISAVFEAFFKGKRLLVEAQVTSGAPAKPAKPYGQGQTLSEPGHD
jgi:hypothetical protein